MATKKTKAVAKPPAMSTKERTKLVSKVALNPSANGAAVVEAYSKDAFGEADIVVLVDELRTQFDKVENGDLQNCEAMTAPLPPPLHHCALREKNLAKGLRFAGGWCSGSLNVPRPLAVPLRRCRLRRLCVCAWRCVT